MPLWELFVAMLWFFVLVAWISLVVEVFRDIFRSEDLRGGTKAVWTVAVLLLPLLGVFVYLIARGGEMHDRELRAAAGSDRARQAYIRGVVGVPSRADELAKLAQLRDRGVLDVPEYENQKAMLLA
jgi:hypothetical protein